MSNPDQPIIDEQLATANIWWKIWQTEPEVDDIIING